MPNKRLLALRDEIREVYKQEQDPEKKLQLMRWINLLNAGIYDHEEYLKSMRLMGWREGAYSYLADDFED
jgi:hypothetical protein